MKKGRTVMKKMKKLTALCLCVLMLLGSLSCAVFAEEKEFYLVLGDSIGYGSGIRNSKEACYGKIVADTTRIDILASALEEFK